MMKQLSRVFGFILTVSVCQGSVAQDENQLIVPDDLTANKTDKYQLQETRVGHRLDRVTVAWENGITEVYQNRRDDTIWSAEENQLGDTPNVRQWRLGSW